MGNKLYDETAIQGIANAIRTKNGSNDTYTVSQMANAIISIPSGGGGVNVFTQTTEPTTKKGIWLQINKEYQNIETEDDFPELFSWDSNYSTMPSGCYIDRPAVATVGNNIYIFGSGNSNYYQMAYKFDTTTKTFTQLTNIPTTFYKGTAVAIGTDIYLVANEYPDLGNKIYKYDTLTDTYTELNDLSASVTRAAVTNIGNIIYFFSPESNPWKAYKYDTTDGTFSSFSTTLPIRFLDGACVSIGTNIYFFSGYNNYQKAYKYDSLLNSYTQLTNIPYQYSKGALSAYGNTIVLAGSGYNGSNSCYRYSILDDTYTQITDLPVNIASGGRSSTAGNKIYYFSWSFNGQQKMAALNCGSKIYPNDSVIIAQEIDTYKTELFNIENGKIDFPFNDAYYYTTQDGLDGTMSAYYGNGTQWVKFKN